MTKDELIKHLRDCNSGDIEVDHINADDLLIEYIDDDEITSAFEDVGKCYA